MELPGGVPSKLSTGTEWNRLGYLQRQGHGSLHHEFLRLPPILSQSSCQAQLRFKRMCFDSGGRR